MNWNKECLLLGGLFCSWAFWWTEDSLKLVEREFLSNYKRDAMKSEAGIEWICGIVERYILQGGHVSQELRSMCSFGVHRRASFLK